MNEVIQYTNFNTLFKDRKYIGFKVIYNIWVAGRYTVNITIFKFNYLYKFK